MQNECFYLAIALLLRCKNYAFVRLSHSLYNPLLVNQLQEEGKSSLNIWK